LEIKDPTHELGIGSKTFVETYLQISGMVENSVDKEELLQK
jgi:hypothetical protein